MEFFMKISEKFKVLSNIKDDFIQVKNVVVLNLNVYDLAVYCNLMRYMNYNTKECFPSLNRLRQEIDISKDRLIKSLKSLEEKQLIHIQRTKETNTNNNVNQYTFLEPNIPSLSGVPPKDLVRKIDLPSPSDRPPLVREIDTKEMNVNKRNNNMKEKAKPSVHLDRKKFFKSLVGDNEKQIEYLKTSMRRFKENNPNKYPDEFLKYFYEQMILEDDFGITKFQDTFTRKGAYTFSVGGQLNTWFNYWKPNKANNLSFREQDRKLSESGLDILKRARMSQGLNLIDEKGKQIG